MLVYIRGVVRPTLTWGGFAVVSALVLLGREVPVFYIALVSGMVGYWFAERKMGNGEKK